MRAVAVCWVLLSVVGFGCDGSSSTEPDLDQGSDPDLAESDSDTADVPSCGPATGWNARLEGIDALLPSTSRSALARLAFGRAVSGLVAGSTVVLEGGGRIAEIRGGPSDYELALEGLESNGDYVLRVLPEGGDARVLDACEQPLDAALSLSFGVDGWRHRGEVTTRPLATAVTPYFVNITVDSGLVGLTDADGRAMVVDVDGDGIEDLFVWPTSRKPMHPKVLRRTLPGGQPSFMEVGGLLGIGNADAAIFAFGDVDNDGDLDAFAGTSSSNPATELGIWLNDGTGRYSFLADAGFASAIAETINDDDFYKTMSAVSFADFDGDGFLDLYIGTWYSSSPTTDGQLYPPDDELYRGDGTGHFSLVDLPEQHNPLSDVNNPELREMGRAAYGMAVGDYDNDGDLDIFVNNYGAGRPSMGSPPLYIDHNFLWRNDGAMSFVDVGIAAGVAATTRGIRTIQEEEPVVMDDVTYPGPIGGNGFGCQWGDFDNDADLDLIVGTIAHPDYPQTDRTLLHVNPGGADPVFSEESLERGLQYYEDELHPVWVDFDNDGRLDLAVSRLRGGSKWEFYIQDAEQHFVKQTYAATGVDVTRPGPTVWLDVDDDGDLDFYMARDSAGAEGMLMRNEVGAANNHLSFELVGGSPRDATGARITLESSVGTQVRELTSGNGHYNTQSSRRLHFGLGGESGARNVRIRWPNGELQELGDVKANLRLRVTQGGAVEPF